MSRHTQENSAGKINQKVTMNVSHNNIHQGVNNPSIFYNSSQVQQINLGIPDEENEDKSLVCFDAFGEAVS